MAEASLLDTSVVLGFCFRDDTHHFRAKSYIEEKSASFYISDHVKDEYIHRRPSLADEISEDILEHIFRLKKSEYEGQLDSMDTSKIRQNYISGNNQARATLEDFYQNGVPNFIQFDDLIDRLRDLARDIEQNALSNYDWLMDKSTIWEREKDYPDIEENLNEIPGDDRRICIDAHDVAETTEQETELATANPKDFTRGGNRELILNHTRIRVHREYRCLK